MTAARFLYDAQGEPAAAVSLYGQAILWGLAIAVAMVIVCAAGWAIASTSANPAQAGRAKTGLLVALVGALLLGVSHTYLEWLNTTQAPAFTADPADYAVDASAPTPTIELIDKTTEWTSQINQFRTADGLTELHTDRALGRMATACARKLAGGEGICPGDGQYYETKLAPSQLVLLSDPLTEDTIDKIGPGLLADTSDWPDDVYTAIVAARNTNNGTAVIIAVQSVGPCPSPCTPASDGAYMANVITHAGTPG